MTVFVFGAGATRGASFVDATENPCIPPLDSDFFTQLQRVANPKHRKLIKEVMRDVVGLFGPNFDVTMEVVFTTLEHTIRLLEATGKENRRFSIQDLRQKRDRLIQAVAVVLEESLTQRAKGGKWSREPRDCVHLKKFVKETLRPKDTIITFNYDCMLDYALRAYGEGKWNARYGYGFHLGARGALLHGDKEWQPISGTKATRRDTVLLLKLHGSLSFRVKEPDGAGREDVTLKQRPYTRQKGGMRFTIIPPEWHKTYDKGVFKTLWQRAAAEVFRARDIVFVGYSLPTTDMHATALFRTSVKDDALRSAIIVNPDKDARRRTRRVIQSGLSRDTKVLSFDSLAQFLALDQSVWRDQTVSHAAVPSSAGSADTDLVHSTAEGAEQAEE